MEKIVDFLDVEEDVGGTGAISFLATDVQEYWQARDEGELDVGESEKVFSRDDFEQALKKVSRRIKK